MQMFTKRYIHLFMRLKYFLILWKQTVSYFTDNPSLRQVISH